MVLKIYGEKDEMSESEHYCAGFARELAYRHKCWFNNGQPFNSVGSQVLGQALPAPSFLHAMH